MSVEDLGGTVGVVVPRRHDHEGDECHDGDLAGRRSQPFGQLLDLFRVASVCKHAEEIGYELRFVLLGVQSLQQRRCPLRLAEGDPRPDQKSDHVRVIAERSAIFELRFELLKFITTFIGCQRDDEETGVEAVGSEPRVLKAIVRQAYVGRSPAPQVRSHQM